MSYTDDSDSRSGGFLSGLLLGAVIGAGVALLFAPESGEATRRKLSKRLQALRAKAGDGAEQLGEELGRQGRRVRRSLSRAAAAAQDELDDVI